MTDPTITAEDASELVERFNRRLAQDHLNSFEEVYRRYGNKDCSKEAGHISSPEEHRRAGNPYAKLSAYGRVLANARTIQRRLEERAGDRQPLLVALREAINALRALEANDIDEFALSFERLMVGMVAAGVPWIEENTIIRKNSAAAKVNRSRDKETALALFVEHQPKGWLAFQRLLSRHGITASKSMTQRWQTEARQQI